MNAELVQLFAQLGSSGVVIWFLVQVWTELKIQNERIYDLLARQEKADAERAAAAAAAAAAAKNRPATPKVNG